MIALISQHYQLIQTNNCQEQPFGSQKKNTTSLFLLDFHWKKVTAFFNYLVGTKHEATSPDYIV
jgi:hypothetical protein